MIKKKNILVLIPVNPRLNPRLLEQCQSLVKQLPAANPDCDLEIIFDSRGPGKNTESFSKFAFDMSKVRQDLVDEYLKPHHDYVFWIDADLVSYPANLISELINRNPDGVSAPIILYEGHGDKFYDLTGFVEDSKWCQPYPPYFSQPGPVYNLEGVGCIYLIPADVYRQGAKHQFTSGFTEHLSVCQKARDLGRPVRAYQDLVAVHAFPAFWQFSAKDNFLVRKIKRWRAKFRIFKFHHQNGVSGLEPPAFVFDNDKILCDKTRKVLYVLRYFPPYLIRFPSLLFNFIGMLVFLGPISALQIVFDFLQLQVRLAHDYDLSLGLSNRVETYSYTEDKPTLSLCTFVKNEKDSIVGMIESVREIVDEIVIVDTGSTDGTQDLVRPLCDKFIEKEFTNFGDIHTFTARQATSDWILMLDADERIWPEDLPKILSLIRRGAYDAWLLPRHQWDNLENRPNRPENEAQDRKVYPDWQARLFRNSPSIKYVRSVHEHLIGYKREGFAYPQNGGPHIHHYSLYFKDQARREATGRFYQQLAEQDFSSS